MGYLIKATYLLKLLLILSVANAAPIQPKNPDYIADQKILLTKKSDGIDASLEVWRDKRLSTADINLMREHDPDNDPTRSLKFQKIPVKPAIIALTSNGSDDSHTIQLLPLEKPYATINDKYIDGFKRIFLITQDFGIAFGSYNGPITQLLEINGNSMNWVKTLDKRSNINVQISLLRSLKSAWNFDPKTNDILQIRCRPSDSLDTFITYFSRYHHNDRGWTLITRSEPMFWEAEDGDKELGVSLPDLKKFPQ
jgi:hypothetical protein